MNPIFMYVVWSAVGVAAVMLTIFLLGLLLSLRPLIQRLAAIAEWVEASRPRYVHMLEDLEALHGELRGISESAHRMVSTVEDFGDDVSSAAQPLVEEVQKLSRTARHAHAAIAAVRIGLDTFFVHRRATLSEPEPSVNSYQES